jgi:hypothetical protein
MLPSGACPGCSTATSLPRGGRGLLAAGSVSRGRGRKLGLGETSISRNGSLPSKSLLESLYEQQRTLSAAEQLLTGVLEEDPTDEDVLELLLRLLGRQGMRHRAWRLYEQFQQTLLQEEGRQPGIRVQHVLKQDLDEGSSLSSRALFAPADSHEVASGNERTMPQQSREDYCSTMNALRRHLLETNWRAIESWSISSLVGPFNGDNSLDQLIPSLLKITPAD